MKKLLAFTLAETLIVIGIIGVVSALTLPNLNSSTGEKEKVAKVKKIYQNLDDAVGRAVAIYGPIDEWKLLDNTNSAQITRFGNRITEFMKVSKNCGFGINNSCYKMSTSKFLNGTVYGKAEDMGYTFILADGTSVAIMTVGSIEVDIDGPNKGSTTMGKDVFPFDLDDSDNGFIQPFGADYTYSNILTYAKPNGKGTSATYWVINYDNMDYLKLDSSGKCPNGKSPTQSNPRCN